MQKQIQTLNIYHIQLKKSKLKQKGKKSSINELNVTSNFTYLK